MKQAINKTTRLFLLVTVCMIVVCTGYGQNTSGRQVFLDSTLKKKLADSVQQQNSRIIKLTKDSAEIAKRDSLVRVAGNKICIARETPPKGFEWLLILSPLAIFLLMLFILMLTGLKSFNLKEALSENEYPKMVLKNPQYTQTNLKDLAANTSLSEVLPPTIEISNDPRAIALAYTDAANISTLLEKSVPKDESKPIEPRPHASISRYIAFISSMLTLVVALCMSCFFIYHYIRTGCPPDLGAVTTILLALGLGLLPYAFNKISTAVKKSEED